MLIDPTTRASLLLRLHDSKDHEAWLDFVNIYEPVAYRLFRRHGLQDADAREVMQQLFLIVSRNIDRWESTGQQGSFRTWLRKVARNLVINWMKHRDRRLIAVGGTEAQVMLQLIPDDTSAESIEFDREIRRSIFQRASEKVRNEVSLSTWQAFYETAVLGISPADTAKKLGMTVGAICVAKCRVVARLRNLVKEWENKS